MNWSWLKNLYNFYQLILLNLSDYNFSSMLCVSGTTWLSNVVSLMLAGEAGYAERKKKSAHERVLFLEYLHPGETEYDMDKLDSVTPPRALKTHLPYRFMKRWIDEEKVRAIVTTRNPKQTTVSYYHFYHKYKGEKNKQHSFISHWPFHKFSSSVWLSAFSNKFKSV